MTYGSYIVLTKVSDPDELLEKVTKAFPQVVHQIQESNHALGNSLDLDTLQFYVHTHANSLGSTLGWKCDEKVVSPSDG